MRKFFLLIALAGTTLNSAQGQVYSFQTYGKELARREAVAPMPEGFGQFGESIDFNSGSVAFRKTLVELRGNNSLRVAADFEYRTWDRPDWPPRYEWRRALPYIVGIHSVENEASGWVVGNITAYTKQRCSDPLKLGVATKVRSSKPPVDNFIPEDYWDGNSLVGVEGGGIIRPLDSAEPTLAGANIQWSTNEGWRFSCYLLPDGSEGFIGHKPNGDKYYFGIPEAGDVMQIRSNWHNDADTWLEVAPYKMPLTRIEDRFGNWVNYTSNQIVSSDGRTITFETTPNGMNVSANGQTWTIVGDAEVTNPDGSAWSISQMGTISKSNSADDLCVNQKSIALGYSGQIVVTVKLESGAKGVFAIQPRRHGYSQVRYRCNLITSYGPSYPEMSDFVDEISLVSREVQGPGVQSVLHSIDYGPVNACYSPVTGVAVPDVCTTSSPTTRTVTVTGSDNSYMQYVFGNNVRINSGLLISKNTGNAREEKFEYELPYQNWFGLGKRKIYNINESHVVVTKQQTITQDGRNFMWKIASDCGSSADSLCIDNHFRPTKVIRLSSP